MSDANDAKPDAERERPEHGASQLSDQKKEQTRPMTNPKPSAIEQPAPPAYVAWRRRDGHRRAGWEAIASGSTEREASERLYDMMRQERGSWSTVVLPAGQEP
jgi:hypothetical protein